MRFTSRHVIGARAGRMARSAGFPAALAIAVGLVGAASAQEPIRLGVLPSATGPGASIGAALTVGVEMAVTEINKAGGIGGRPVTLVKGDTQSNPTTAASEAKRLVERERIDLLIGPLVSQEVVPTVTVTTDAKILQFTNAGTTALTPQVGPYHFSLNASSETVAGLIAGFVADTMKGASVGILADDGGQSRTGGAALKKSLEARGIKLAVEQEFRNRTDDMTPQVLSLKRANPDVVLVYLSFVEDGARMLNTFRDVGWQPKVVGSTAISVYAAAIARSVDAKAFDNVHSIAYRGLTYCPADASGRGPYAEFGEKLKAFAPALQGKVSVSLASEYYDAVKLLEAGVKAVGTKGPDLARWMETEGSKVSLIHGAISPSAESHFLFGANELSPVERPNQVREDGLMRRVGC